MAINQKVAALFSGLALAANLGLVRIVKAEEFNPNGWPKPNTARATLTNTQIRTDLVEGYPNIRVIQRTYKTPERTYFNTLSVIGDDGKEKTWGYYVDTDGKPPMEYGLVDHVGDGKFRHKYEANERMRTPSYVLSGQISKN